jgi:hypothetical protein
MARLGYIAVYMRCVGCTIIESTTRLVVHSLKKHFNISVPRKNIHKLELGFLSCKM